MRTSDVLQWIPILALVLGLIYYFWPRRRFKLPPIVFDNPEPRDDGPQRWWHIPIHIEKPASRFVAFFTKLEIVEVHAEMTISEWGRNALVVRWESDDINGAETVNLGYHPTQFVPLIKILPIAIRRTAPGKCFRGIYLDTGETYLTEHNFVHGAIKTSQAFLQNGKKYSLTLRLWSTKHPNLSESKKYLLFVPGSNDSNDSFALSLV